MNHIFSNSWFRASIAILLIGVSIFSFHRAFAETDAQQRARLEAELKQLEAEIAQKEGELAAQKQNSASLSGEVSKLQTEIEKAQLEIKKKGDQISKLSKDISKKANTITQLGNELNREKSSLAQIIRKKNELDSYTLFEYLLSSEDVSQFYGDADSFQFIQGSLAESFGDIRYLQGKTEEERKALLQQKNQETDVKVALEEDKKEVEVKKGEKNNLLSISINKEKGYEQVIAERKAKATEIRNALFRLAGGVQGGGIPFGEAVQYAKAASAKTGVRTALILAILKQESNLGANVGTCYLKNKDTGAGVRISTGEALANVMKPTRDVAPFIEITKALGLDPYNTRVSCPFSYGYGGAMGPSQFIASTWKLFASRIASALGVPASNPWNPQHAIMATALYMKDLGAASGGFTAERDAACKYYSGRPCSTPGVQNLFYGNSVMALATQIEADIKLIDEN